ncbi:MAG TPA: AI-2E family transporter [Thermoanaerobaculia bacterium]|jgi:predicted PurR-regulated permease PerM/methanogenic corrinoid protein MtbC1|nr:AI-2E family transporter [Thermoanaerobaculia bacterium]
MSVRRMSTSPGTEVVDKRAAERRQSNTRILSVTLIVIAILYIARTVLVPIALAILFSFLLTPIVRFLERSFLRRTGAIVLSLGLTITGLGFGGWWIYQQFSDVAQEFAQTAASGHIEEKLKYLRSRTGGTLAIFERTLQRVADAREHPEKADLKVRVIPERKSIPERYELVAPQVEVVAAGFLVVVLVFFVLQDREQLRDKMLRLAGRAHLTVTTQAIGETSERISQYLLTIALLNIGFGLLIGLGLWLLRVPHAALWGVIAGLLRFVPYIGAVISAALPTFLALAVFPNWYSALAVLGLFIFSDQLIGGFVEPIVVGHRVGVSPIALLVAAIFWGWLWGPVGLLLATPITVCLTVGGEFIPALRIFSIMFGSEDPLEGYLSFYNRLLLRDRTGAIAIADRHSEAATMEEMFTDLFIPTLTFAQEELERKRITPAHDHFIKDVIRELIIRFGDRNAGTPDPERHIVAVSVAGERLSLGTLMLTQLLRAEGHSVDYFTDLPDPELVAFINEVKPEAVFISCSNMDHVEQGYALLRLLAENFPDLMIVAGGSGFARDHAKTLAAGATYVPSTLTEAKEDFLTRRKGGKKKTSRSITFSGQRFRVPPPA